MAQYEGWYGGREIISVPEVEYYSDKYISRCKLLNTRVSRTHPGLDLWVDKGEYEYALSCSNKERYQTYQPTPSWQSQYDPYGVVPLQQEPQETPKEKKQEKAPKQVRHQFLRRRLQNKLNK